MRARRQAGGDPGADHRAGAAALRHRHQPLPQLSGDDRGALALQDAGAEEKDFAKRGGGEDRPAHRHALAAAKGAALQGPRIARHRRGAALRRDAQGKAQGAFQAGGHAHALRDAHSAHTEHGAVGHPRYVYHRDAAAGPSAGADLCTRARLGRDRRSHPARAFARRAGLLPAQPCGDHRPLCRAAQKAPRRGGQHCGRARQAGRKGPEPCDAAVFRRRGADPGLHHHHRNGHRHSECQHPCH